MMKATLECAMVLIAFVTGFSAVSGERLRRGLHRSSDFETEKVRRLSV